METLVIKIKKKQSMVVKQFLDQQKVSYETSPIKVKHPPKKEKPYDPEFVKMVLERKKNIDIGNTIEYTDEIRKSLFHS